MSSLERALNRLRETAPSQSSASPAVARVLENHSSAGPSEALAASTGASNGKSIEFNRAALRDAGLLCSSNEALAGQYRTIKQPLLKLIRQPEGERVPGANLVLVASALAGEGKTFTCVNLSMSLATEKDWDVLLVDVDCKRPQLSRLLGVENEPGILELIKDPTLSVESLVLSTNIAGLSVLPVGALDEHSTELLASTRMMSICRELAATTPRRIVVFDSSPLLLTTEAAVLATHVGQVVLVVRAGTTPQEAVVNAVAKLDHEKAIGLVLNAAPEAAKLLQYGGYDAYSYAAT